MFSWVCPGRQLILRHPGGQHSLSTPETFSRSSEGVACFRRGAAGGRWRTVLDIQQDMGSLMEAGPASHDLHRRWLAPPLPVTQHRRRAAPRRSTGGPPHRDMRRASLRQDPTVPDRRGADPPARGARRLDRHRCQLLRGSADRRPVRAAPAPAGRPRPAGGGTGPGGGGPGARRARCAGRPRRPPRQRRRHRGGDRAAAAAEPSAGPGRAGCAAGHRGAAAGRGPPGPRACAPGPAGGGAEGAGRRAARSRPRRQRLGGVGRRGGRRPASAERGVARGTARPPAPAPAPGGCRALRRRRRAGVPEARGSVAGLQPCPARRRRRLCDWGRRRGGRPLTADVGCTGWVAYRHHGLPAVGMLPASCHSLP
uniref:Uncharacterized protein n=1 Tax=Auxenochlorella protothecoides TaxID=3075 RepID=A0A1D1ZNT5_AUXPR